jgi:hypothetical protein
VISHPLHAVAVSLGGKDIKADLGPVVDPLGQLDRFVLLVLGGQHAELGCGASLHRKIAMQLDSSVLGAIVSDGYTWIS